MSDSVTSAAPVSHRFLPAERRAAALVLGAAFMLLADTSIVNVAMPSLQRDLGASVPEVQLVVAGYVVAYAVMLITGGRLGDLYGRRRMFMIGAVSFTLASLACGLAQGPGALIAARVWQGLSASVLYPQIIATLHIAIPTQRRGRAFALLGAVVSCATIAGPIIAGLLIAADVAGLQWRPIFLINIPVGIVLIALAPRMVPAHKGLRLRLDYAGSFTVVLLLVALLVPLTIGRDQGWPLWGWLLLLCAPVLLVVFLRLESALERQGKVPLLRPGLWTDPAFRLSLALFLVYFSAIVPFFLYFSITLQYGVGYGALATAAAMAPYAVGSTITSLWSARVVARFTAPRTILVGCASCAVGSALMIATLGWNSSGHNLGWAMAPTMVFTGLGLGLVLGPLLNFVMARVRHDDSGAVSGALSTAQQLGSSLGVAVIGLAFFRGFQGELTDLGYPALRTDMMLGLVVVVAAFVLAAALVWLIARRTDTDSPA
ncbi:MFS transporter [Streptomyces flavofungini]|uniref:MFS transporter n=1 Tax=Streptomyces flavofungini TaxID=68200 RepID=A0ABS0X780_9ACTN|nr:MFS transporter [Streptomyces flavofungini]MBJ3809072.1 MFS transporter [Streptomyces flavofungini]GHC68390.1 MFS transporter [Streptomyces flavofungini]